VYSVRIIRGGNGYRLNWTEDTEDGEIKQEEYIQDDEADELRSTEALLWWILEWAGKMGSKHDPERLRVVREKRDE